MLFADQNLKKETLILTVACLSVFATIALAQEIRHQPGAFEPANHSFPTLGATSKRKMEVAWNRFYDHSGLGGILTQLHEAFPELTRLYSIGQSSQGKDLWCIEITALNIGDPARKPGIYLHGNIHGNEVQTGELLAYTAWYLCHQYGRLDKVTSLLDNRVFYIIPTINPDGRDEWLHGPHTSGSSRSGLDPKDNDQDGQADEDGPEDLNGDGFITMMRTRDVYAEPGRRYKPHPDYPDQLMVQAEPDELGQYCLLGWEGIDNDEDGRINEDGPGGYDLNRNWGYDWQPDYIQGGAQDYPFSQSETRAVKTFVLEHPNIAAAQTFHNTGGMILRSPGREGGAIQGQDEQLLAMLSERGAKILPFYRPMIVWKDLYSVWGGEQDWLYAGQGILTFTNELWTRKNLYKENGRPSDTESAEFIDYVLLGDGFLPWQEYDHPTYGKVEIGGFKKEWGRTPPSFLLEEELHRNMAFALYHADMMPLLKMGDIQIEPLADNLFKVWITVENQRLIPTRTAQDTENHINRPDIITLAGKELKVLSSGQVTDRYFKRVQAVEHRPERLVLDAIDGMSSVTVQFVVSGQGDFTITVDSPKGGWLQEKKVLP